MYNITCIFNLYNIICARLRALILYLILTPFLFVSFDINFKSIFPYFFSHTKCYSFCSTVLENCPSSSCLLWNTVHETSFTLDHTELGRSKIVLPRDWSEKPNKTSWNFAVLPLLHLLYQKSPSSKSRIRVYLLLGDRDPTTTTHNS